MQLFKAWPLLFLLKIIKDKFAYTKEV